MEDRGLVWRYKFGYQGCEQDAGTNLVFLGLWDYFIGYCYSDGRLTHGWDVTLFG